ncbi:MAG TPA: superoxide dismutase [Candidatus Enterocloster faecavium]|uniref:Superoxide dismutase n=1 Tax=Candidatus Enterocloster faecavium TaxID=2838560 RepID=A0A9D2RM62_9FIRM|nr:superoxide dismutase [Candidatus Enterocloster faecavium]
MISTQTYPFSLPPLPYAYDALEPYIDRETMHFHHDKHMKTYVDNLNKALEPYPQYHHWTLERLLLQQDELPDSLKTSVRNNGGGVYNHDLYFSLMAPAGQQPLAGVTEAFGGDEQWKAQMKSAALGQFGSGFAWLVSDSSGALSIIALPNQDNPLSLGFYPILPLDVWEHAYYLKHQNLRGDYIDQWFHVINWEGVKERMSGRQY